MIVWKDFVLDDVCGPLLMEGPIMSLEVKVCRGKRLAGKNSMPNVMEDSTGEKAVLIQETGQEQRPARMVGLSDLDSISLAGMDAGRHDRLPFPRLKEEA